MTVSADHLSLSSWLWLVIPSAALLVISFTHPIKRMIVKPCWTRQASWLSASLELLLLFSPTFELQHDATLPPVIGIRLVILHHQSISCQLSAICSRFSLLRPYSALLIRSLVAHRRPRKVEIRWEKMTKMS